MEFGKTIRILRQAKEVSLSDLAGRAGVSIPYLSLLESGQRQPSLDVINRVAVALSIPAEVLLLLGQPRGSTLSSDCEQTETLTRSLKKLKRAEDSLRDALEKLEDENASS